MVVAIVLNAFRFVIVVISPASQPSNWVLRYMTEIPRAAGPVLDLACGSGRHSRLLKEAGYEVWAVDQRADLLDMLRPLGIRCFELDLETADFVWPFADYQFAAIVVTNYLHRPLMSKILESIMHQGVLIYETFAAGNEQFGRPRNPDFLLAENELLNHFVFTQQQSGRQQCLGFEHCFVNQPSPAIVQRICVRKLRSQE